MVADDNRECMPHIHFPSHQLHPHTIDAARHPPPPPTKNSTNNFLTLKSCLPSSFLSSKSCWKYFRTMILTDFRSPQKVVYILGVQQFRSVDPKKKSNPQTKYLYDWGNINWVLVHQAICGREQPNLSRATHLCGCEPL